MNVKDGLRAGSDEEKGKDSLAEQLIEQCEEERQRTENRLELVSRYNFFADYVSINAL